jgi:hypothetical protein
MTAAAPPPPPTIVAAVKAVYPRSPIRIVRICRDEPLALVRLRVRARDSFVALRHAIGGWRVLWIDGRVAKSVSPARRAAVQHEVDLLRVRCLSP